MAVYTTLTDTEIISLLREYSIGTLVDFIPIAEGVENTNYLLHTTQDKFILTLFEKRVNPKDIPFFLALKHYLNDQDFICPKTIKTSTGKLVTEIKNKPAAIISFLEGKSIHDITAKTCGSVGEILAKLHLAAQDFPMSRSNDMGIQFWTPLFQEIKQANPDTTLVSVGIDNNITESLALVTTQWPSDLPQGIIHADLFPDNVFFLNNHISGVIDFYFACRDFLAYDIAITVNAWCFDTGEINQSKLSAILKAYHQHRPLTTDELSFLPILGLGAALRFYLTRLYDKLYTDKDALITPKDPNEYLQKIHFYQHIITNYPDLFAECAA